MSSLSDNILSHMLFSIVSRSLVLQTFRLDLWQTAVTDTSAYSLLLLGFCRRLRVIELGVGATGITAQGVTVIISGIALCSVLHCLKLDISGLLLDDENLSSFTRLS